MRKIVLFILITIVCISGCHEKSFLNDKYLEIVDIISKDDFSLKDAQKVWDIYENELFASVGFCEDKLIKQGLFVFGDLNQRIKSQPSEVRSSFKKLRAAFCEFLRCVRRFKVTDDDRRGLICKTIESASADILTNLFYNNRESFDEELFEELNKDNSNLPPYLCAYLYYDKKGDFYDVSYDTMPLYIHTIDVYQTKDKNIKLLILHDTSCQAEVILIAYNKKTHEFKQISAPKDLYFDNHSSHDHYTWDPQSNTLSDFKDGTCTRYLLDLKNLKLTRQQ